MDIKQLEYFLQVIKDKSITKAAEGLFLSQPAISKALKNLEEELGVQLMIKTRQGIIPTDEGLQLVENAAPLVDAFNHIHEELHDGSAFKKGSVSIGMGPVFGFSHICTILSEFQNSYPNINVTLKITSAKERKSMLMNYELDIAVLIEPENEEVLKSLDYQLIHRDILVVVCNKNHRLCQLPRLTMADLHDEPFNICSREYYLHRSIIQLCHEAGFSPKINFQCNSMELLLDMTASGKGICILPRSYAEKISNCFPSNQILFPDPSIPWSSYIATRKSLYQSYSLLALTTFIKKYFHEHFPADLKVI